MKLNQSLNGALASSIVALLLTTNLSAATNSTSSNTVAPPVKKVEKDNFGFNFPKDMNLCNPEDIYFYVAGLAMQASEGGLEFGIVNNNGATSQGAVLPISGKVLNFDWNYNPGFRVGLGGYIDHDAWNLEANYTWVHFSNSQQYQADGSSKIVATWGSGSDNTAASLGNTVSAEWHGQYHVVDAWMGKPYHVSRHFLMNPVLGLRVGIIDQKYDVNYGGATTSEGLNSENNFIGLGLRAGMNSEWVVSKQWRFFGSFAASLLRGHFAVNEKFSVPKATPSLNGTGVHENFWDTVPELEMTFGLQWGIHFNCDRNYVAVRAAYEFQEWFDQFLVRKVYAGGLGSTNGLGNEALRTDFSLNGFTLAVQFDF